MDAPVRIRIPKEVKAALQRKADGQSRRFQRRVTLSDVMREIIITQAAQTDFERAT